MEGDRERCLEAGMDDFLSKPTNPEQLRETLQKWLTRTEILVHDSLPLRWHTVFPFLARFWPLRI